MERTDDILESRCQLGMAIRRLREEHRLSQKKLGLMVGLDRSYISRIERGRCSMTLDTLLLLANGFDVSPSELLSGIGIDPETEPLPVALTVPTSMRPHYHATRL